LTSSLDGEDRIGACCARRVGIFPDGKIVPAQSRI